MADAVAARVITDSKTHIVLHLTNIGDGTGEAAVIKADKSTYLASDGAEPASLDIESVRWNIQGFTSVRLLWDHTTDDLALVMAGSGYDDFRGGGDMDATVAGRLKDPRSAGGTGDLLLTTNGGSSGASYDITISMRKLPD